MVSSQVADPGVAGPKYKQIYTKLRQALTNREYTVGDKLPSENELVEMFTASRPTVARALARLETEGLVTRRAGSGTFVCEPSFKGGLVFGLLIPGLGATEIFEPICRGISTAQGSGYHDLLWGSTYSPEASEEFQTEQLCEYYVQRGVSGVFFAPLELSGKKDEINQRITRMFDDAWIPVVLLDRDIFAYPRRSKYDMVGIDNRRAGYVVANHVLECGAKRVVFLARPNSAPTVAERALGCQEAVRACAVPGTEGWTEIGDPAGCAFVEGLMSRLRPDAIVCANDSTAARLMTTLNALGIRVPSDVMVTGMDDIRYASVLQTPLTTIHQPCQELGAAALATMLSRIAQPQIPVRTCLIDFNLVVRQSTGAPRDGDLS